MDERQQKIMARIEQAEKWRDANYGALWEDCYRRYRSQPLPRNEGSNIFVPHTYMQCEVIKARIRENLFKERPYISVLPVERGDMAHAANMELLLDWQMNERMSLPRVIGEEAATSLVVYGTAVAYSGWQLKTRRVTRGIPIAKPLRSKQGASLYDDMGQELTMASLEPVESEEVVYDDPLVVNISLADFFVDEEATDIEDARFCGHREYQTREALEALEEQGKYRIDWQQLSENSRKDDSYFGKGEAKSLYEVHHYWEDERHVVILEREQVICDEANPFWHGMKPYDKCCYVNLPDDFYGMGIPEALAGLQDELNTARNQRVDYNSMALRRMWKLRRGCGLTARDLVWRQNGVLQVDNMDDIMEINIQGLPADAFANESAIKQDMQDTTGCHDILMGLSYANETATTTMTRDNNASLRFKSVITGVVNDLLVPIARKCASMDQQFLSEIKMIRILGEDSQYSATGDIRGVGPYEICGNFDLIFCGSSIEPAASKQLNKEKALQAYSLALADPAYQADEQARMRLFRRVLEALEIKDAANLLPQSAQPVVTTGQEQQLATALAGGMAAGSMEEAPTELVLAEAGAAEGALR